MAPPANAAHLVYSGVLPGGEEFATGYWVNYSGGETTPGGLDVDFEAFVATQLTELQTLATALLPSTGGWRAADMYLYPGNSTQASGQAHVDLNINGAGGVKYPNQCALVVSLQTGFPGRSSRGRMYLPCLTPTGDTSNSLQVPTAFATTIAQTLAGMLNSGPALGFSPSVVSTTRGFATPMQSVKVDCKIDTQRRRAEKVVSIGSSTQPVNNT